METRKDFSINAGGKLLSLTPAVVMGILNATPDSFYAGSRKQTEAEIAGRACQIVAEGGAIIDVGAFSTRPGAREVSREEETERLRHCLAIVRREVPDAVVSVDTFRPEVARMAVEEFGVAIVNDVSEGGQTGVAGVPLPEGDSPVPAMFAEVARLGVAYVLMSVQPTMKRMLLGFAKEVEQLRSLGVKDIILDPGFGFGKTLEDNYAILATLDRLGALGLPVLAGVSRKSMITGVLGVSTDDALNGTTAANAIALARGAAILRVHDVREAVECVKIAHQCDLARQRRPFGD